MSLCAGCGKPTVRPEAVVCGTCYRSVRVSFARRHRVDSETGCWVWTGGFHTTGYGALRDGRRGGTAHRISWEIHYGSIPDGLEVCHRCDNRACVNPEHLFLGTHQDNMTDMVNKGRAPVGQRAFGVKLTPEQVLAIRNDPRSQSRIGREYGVTQTTVGLIKRRKRWKHI